VDRDLAVAKPINQQAPSKTTLINGIRFGRKHCKASALAVSKN
jgi:hypothetical protein